MISNQVWRTHHFQQLQSTSFSKDGISLLPATARWPGKLNVGGISARNVSLDRIGAVEWQKSQVLPSGKFHGLMGYNIVIMGYPGFIIGKTLQ